MIYYYRWFPIRCGSILEHLFAALNRTNCMQSAVWLKLSDWCHQFVLHTFFYRLYFLQMTQFQFSRSKTHKFVIHIENWDRWFICNFIFSAFLQNALKLQSNRRHVETIAQWNEMKNENRTKRKIYNRVWCSWCFSNAEMRNTKWTRSARKPVPFCGLAHTSAWASLIRSSDCFRDSMSPAFSHTHSRNLIRNTNSYEHHIQYHTIPYNTNIHAYIHWLTDWLIIWFDFVSTIRFGSFWSSKQFIAFKPEAQRMCSIREKLNVSNVHWLLNTYL